MKEFFLIHKNNKYGAKNKHGEVILKPIYDVVGKFSNKFLYARKNKKYKIFDIKTGKEVFPLWVDDIKIVRTNKYYQIVIGKTTFTIKDFGNNREIIKNIFGSY